MSSVGGNVLNKEKYMDEVWPNIWIGEKRAAFDDQINKLKKHNIAHIVSIGYYQQWWKDRKEIKHLLLPIKDSPFIFITDYFGKVFKFIDSALTNDYDKDKTSSVLIQCDQGRSRSGAFVIAYLMKKYKTSYPETLNKILIQRKRVMPNIGFQIQLRQFGKRNWKTSIQYSNELDIDKELATALKNLAGQVSKLQNDIRKSEKLYVTLLAKDINDKDFNITANVYTNNNNNKKKMNKKRKSQELKNINNIVHRTVRIGLSNGDLIRFRKEWVLLVFLCHQFQLYKIGVHRSIITILHILGEMYFTDLVRKFMDVFEPLNKFEKTKYKKNKYNNDDIKIGDDDEEFPLVLEYNDASEAIKIARLAYKSLGKINNINDNKLNDAGHTK